MNKLLIRWIANAGALFAAVAILQPNIRPGGNGWVDILWLALIFGIVNAVIKPLLIVASCPFLILTLGLGTLIINTLMFLLSNWIGSLFHIGLVIEKPVFLWAFVGSIIVSVISFILSRFLGEDAKPRRITRK